MITAESLISELTDEQLEQAYQELESWWSTAALPEDTIIRSIYNRLDNPSYAVVLIATPLFHEMVRRYRRLFDAIEHVYDTDTGTELQVCRKMYRIAKDKKMEAK